MIPRLGLMYCGHQMPWSHSFRESHATVTFDTAWGMAKGYYFVMTFEAFDIMLKSVGYIHRGESLYNRDNYNWILLERNHDFNFIKTEFQISFYATVVQQIILKYPTTPQFSRHPFYKDLPDNFYILSDVRVYDGPGILSPLVVPTCNASTEYCTCYLSSYQGFMKYQISRPSNVWNGYIPIPYRYSEHVREQGILWENNEVLNSSIDCVKQEKDIHFHSQSGICWGQPFHSLIKIHFMDFIGYEKTDNQVNCAYGGLFILLYRWRDKPRDNNPITICSNIDSEIILPYKVHTHSIRTVIVFKTFKGYSHGSTDLTISSDPDCIGWNYMSTITSHCAYKWDWHRWKDLSNEKTHSPTCSDFWLTHYVTDILNPSELENSIFSFNLSNKLRRTVGSFKFMVSGLIVYKNFTSVISSHTKSCFNMIIESVSRRDFPFNPTKKKTIFNLKLPTPSKQTFLFNPVSNLYVKFNYTGAFEQHIFVTRMQILENVICTSVEDHHPLDIAQMYTLNSDISDVYLSRIYPYNGYMIKSMNYTGYNRGSCRVLLKGQSCSHSSSYKVIQIHYRPNIKLQAAHRM